MDYSRDESWRSLEEMLLGGVVARPSAHCGLVHCEPGWRWDARVPDFAIWVVLSGQGAADVGDARIILEPGTALLLRPGTEGSFTQDPRDRLTVAYCHFDFLDSSNSSVARPSGHLLPSQRIDVHRAPDVVTSLRSLIRLTHSPHYLSTIQRSHLLLGVLIELYRADAAAQGKEVLGVDARIESAVTLISSTPGHRVTLSAAAEGASLSTAHFSRLFRRELGVSFREFCLSVRLERGRQLLQESAMSVTEIAKALGYRELYPFSRAISERYGLTPTGIRKGHLPSDRTSYPQ